jgi:hypothetical protein
VGEGHSSKSRKGAALSNTRALPPDATSGAASSEFEARLRTHDGRLGLYAEIGSELLIEDPSETRQRNLAALLRVVKLAAEEVKDQALPIQMKELAAQFQADREERARMESGVEFADEGAQLPPVSGDECH